MPFKSKKQQRWMFANKPEMAKEWASETNFKNLPERKKRGKKKNKFQYGGVHMNDITAYLSSVKVKNPEATLPLSPQYRDKLYNNYDQMYNDPNLDSKLKADGYDFFNQYLKKELPDYDYNTGQKINGIIIDDIINRRSGNPIQVAKNEHMVLRNKYTSQPERKSNKQIVENPPEFQRGGAYSNYRAPGSMNQIIDRTILFNDLFNPEKQRNFYTQNTAPQLQPVGNALSADEIAQGSPAVPQVNLPSYDDPMQEAIDKGLIQGPDDFGSAQEAYDFYRQKGTNKRGKLNMNPMDMYLGMKATSNALSFVSGGMERGRQNNYMRDQLANMNQTNPIPVSNFQPTPYNPYAKKGGKFRKIKASTSGGY